MRAIVRQEYGGPEQLLIQELPMPQPQSGEVLIQVKAFGLNRAETYMRKGSWGDVVKVSGIECVGLVHAAPGGRLAPGQKVAAVMGGMGRTINGSYAEYTCVPENNVIALDTQLSWEELAALPESYATAWTVLHGNLDVRSDQVLLVRGATSALGQAALNIAKELGARSIATTRNPNSFAMLKALGAEHVLLEAPNLSGKVRELYPRGIDAVCDLVGNSTLLDSLAAVRHGGHVCQAGFLGGGDPLDGFNPLMNMPSGVQLSFFGSFMFGSPEFPLDRIPLQAIVDRVAAGTYQAKPVKVFDFDDIVEAHRMLESFQANGKMVVRV